MISLSAPHGGGAARDQLVCHHDLASGAASRRRVWPLGRTSRARCPSQRDRRELGRSGCNRTRRTGWRASMPVRSARRQTPRSTRHLGASHRSGTSPAADQVFRTRMGSSSGPSFPLGLQRRSHVAAWLRETCRRSPLSPCRCGFCGRRLILDGLANGGTYAGLSAEIEARLLSSTRWAPPSGSVGC